MYRATVKITGTMTTLGVTAATRPHTNFRMLWRSSSLISTSQSTTETRPRLRTCTKFGFLN